MGYRDTLMEVSSECPETKGVVPVSANGRETQINTYYKVLSENPYKYTEQELFKHIHHFLEDKPHLKIESYTMRRSDFPKRYGWGIHYDSLGRLALVGMETRLYSELLQNESIRKI